MVNKNISKHNNKIVHISKIDDLYKLDDSRKYTLLIDQQALKEMSDSDYLKILNLCSYKNLNNSEAIK